MTGPQQHHAPTAMAPTRLFVLSSLERNGEMYPYEICSRGEHARVADLLGVTPGALYGTVRRMVQEGLLRVVRRERAGNRPEREVVALTDAGTRALAEQRQQAMRLVVEHYDPFDLALSQLDDDQLAASQAELQMRLDRLQQQSSRWRQYSSSGQQQLTVAERLAVAHRVHMLEADAEWHRQLLSQSPSMSTWRR